MRRFAVSTIEGTHLKTGNFITPRFAEARLDR